MANVSLIGEEADTRIELKFIEDNKPTPLLLALVAVEITLDFVIAYSAYRIIRFRRR